MKKVKTYLPDVTKIERTYYLIDASDKILGRVATKAAAIIRGKNKRIFTPHLDTGDRVIIINASKIKLSGVSGAKAHDKVYTRYSGYPSGQRKMTLTQMMQKAPTKAMRLAIDRMLPTGRLGNTLRSSVRIYAGDKHPHQSQEPVLLKI